MLSLLFYSAGDIVLSGTLNFPLDSVYLKDYWISWGDGNKIFYLIFGGHQSFRTSGDVCPGFQSQGGSPDNGILRFTSGATPADLLAASTEVDRMLTVKRLVKTGIGITLSITSRDRIFNNNKELFPVS